MPATQEYLANYAAAMQPHCAEPIVAVGAAKAPGAMSAMVTQLVAGKAGRFVGNFLGHKAARAATAPKPRPDGMPDDLLLAVTTTRIHAFGYEPKGSKHVDVTSTYAVWDRAGVVVSADEPGKWTQRITLRWPNGAEVQLDAVLPPGGNRDLNDAFLGALSSTA
jgi:hypothetical protein